MLDIARRHGRFKITKTYLDYAAEHANIRFMLGTHNPEPWAQYLKENYPDCKFKVIEDGILINYKG